MSPISTNIISTSKASDLERILFPGRPGPKAIGTTYGRTGGKAPDTVSEEESNHEETARRRDLVFECLQIYAYEGDDARHHQVTLKRDIDEQLGKCDVCIGEYYRARRRAIALLINEYDEADVASFSKEFDDRDTERISRGLDNAARTLRNTQPEKRSIEALPRPALLSIFEALNCEAFLNNGELVRLHLDEPFNLVQTNKKLIMTQFVPAATVFLFDPDRTRCFWAMKTWSRYRASPATEEFEFAVRDPLLRNLQLASTPGTDLNFLQRFWCGLSLIVDKLDQQIITHSVRAMEVDVFRLALEHLQFDTAGFQYLLQTIKKLLEKSPKDFWDSMGAISPTTVIEQIFNNPQYDRFIMAAREDERYELSALNDMLSWIAPFMASLQAVHQPPACRSLAFQLMDRLQTDRFPIFARINCYKVGLAVLISTLRSCNKGNAKVDAVERVVASDTLEIIGTYSRRILTIPGLPENDGYHQKPLIDSCLTIVKASLALECQSLRVDQEALRNDEDLPQGFNMLTPAIWDAVVQYLTRRNVILAKAALVAIVDLTGLERFSSKETGGKVKYLSEKSEFNVKFGRLTHFVCQILERISDFNPDDLDKLFRNNDTAVALSASLFSADPSTYEAGVDLIKSISSESTRRDAIRHLLLSFFQTTLNSFSWAVKRIAERRTFASCPRMLTTCGDTQDVLCAAQDGLLRIRTFSSVDEVQSVEKFWEHQWQALKVIYEMTEEWHMRGVESIKMKEFCRDTMQFSESFFDQYGVFASVINSTNFIKQETESVGPGESGHGKSLLEHPAKTMDSMVKWLRLKDEYLAGTLAKIVRKILGRLTELRMTLATDTSAFLEGVVHGKTSMGKTTLKPQERAEIARALEANLGRPIIMQDSDQGQSDSSRAQSVELGPKRVGSNQGILDQLGIGKKKHPGTIDLEAWGSKSKVAKEVIQIPDEDEFGDSDIPDNEILAYSRSVEIYKERQASRATEQKTPQSEARRIQAESRVSKVPKSQAQLQKDQMSFKEKREKEREAKRKRDAEQLALLKKKIPLKGIAEQTSAEGSSLNSLGVKGKDHAPKGQSLMVSSGSESDSDDTLDETLFGGKPKIPHVSAAVKDYQANQLQRANRQGPVKKMKQVRSVKDMRARLAPDLSSLHKTILSWDFFHDGQFPPSSGRDDYSLVTNSFVNPLSYQNTFEPLLTLEAWQGFLKSKEEGNFKTFDIRVVSRLTIDSFNEVSTTMTIADGRDLGISEADIVLMSKGQRPAIDLAHPHCLARVWKISKKKNVMDISYRVSQGNDLLPLLVPNANLYGVKVSSITPLEREYGALQGLKYYDLCDEIIKAKPSPLLKYSEKQLDPLVNIYKVNLAQAKAVRSAIDNDAFTLIQGPPGSGKTKTIVAIVGALLTDSLRDQGVAIPKPQNAKTITHNQLHPSAPAAKKLLVCAPSNAAVDELVMRFKHGVKTARGEFHKVNIVRLGRSDAINTNVVDVTLEELVNAKLNLANPKKTSGNDDVHKIMMEHKATCDELIAVRARLDETKAKGDFVSPELERDFEVLKRKKQQLSTRIDNVRDDGNTAARDAEISRRKIQQDILEGAHVICATLSGSGHDMFQNLNIEFETVVIDEAAQSIELSALIPLKYGCSKCILVGDPKQLPPTVLSREAARFQYEQSLFVRMQINHPHDVHLLDTQYRMHPQISLFPSNAFYDGRLLDGSNMADLRKQPWHESNILGPYRFFDVQGSHQSAPRGHSLINIAELDVALQLYDRLITDCKGYNFKGKIGIITPYKSQLRELRSRFAARYTESIFSIVEFNTTDAFQGRESEIIIFSCVRASSSRGIGFLADIRRMNVGLTRAKSSLWILGNSQSLMQGEFWGNLIHDAKARDRYTTGDVLGLLRRPLLDLAVSSSINGNQDRDTEMVDAPVANLSRRESLQRSPATVVVRRESSQSMSSIISLAEGKADVSEPKVSNTSGGFNGLHSTIVCDICGSFKHFWNDCDNDAAIIARYGPCPRCGGPHTKARCFDDRCLECGEFGHSKNACSSHVALSKKDQERISRQEIAHKEFLKRPPFRTERSDHDAKVPIVRSTSKTPPPFEPYRKPPTSLLSIPNKRKRDTSPPPGAPLGPKASKVSKSYSNNVSNRPLPVRQSSSISQNSIASHPKAIRVPTDTVAPKTSHEYQSPFTAKAQDQVGSASLPALKGAPPLKENQPMHAAQSSRPIQPEQPRNVVRPPRRQKKEVNPFIVPKKKKRE